MPTLYLDIHFSLGELISASNKRGTESPLGCLLDYVHTPLVQKLLNNNPLFQRRDLTTEEMQLKITCCVSWLPQ